MGLTEHMPRTKLSDLYPEELEPDPDAALAALGPRHEAFIAEAVRLRAKYAGQVALLVGFEAEWIRPGCYAPLVQELAAHAEVDYFVGSLHHVCGVPIDFSAEMYAQAREEAVKAAAAEGAGKEEVAKRERRETEDQADAAEAALWARYYDEQHAMLLALRPRIVGHFDLIRLFSRWAEVDEPHRPPEMSDSTTTMASTKSPYATSGRRHDLRDLANGTIWARIVRNLQVIKSYGGWLECNSSALRKGLAEPYPARAIAAEWVAMEGRFTMSDDSHGVAQVATCYAQALDYLESLGVDEVWTFERVVDEDGAGGERDVGSLKGAGNQKARLVERSVSLGDFRRSLDRNLVSGLK